MTNVADIRNANWQISTARFGEVVEGTGDINQCIGLILATRIGSDPFRPSFGSKIFEYVDRPINTAAPNIVQAIVDAVGTWERRVVVKAVEYAYQKQNENDANAPVCGIRFNILWVAAVGSENGEIELLLNNTQGLPTLVIRVIATDDGVGITTDDGILIQL